MTVEQDTRVTGLVPTEIGSISMAAPPRSPPEPRPQPELVPGDDAEVSIA